MNVRDVFSKSDGIVRLRYEDFKPLNWTYNDYFHYMSFCDEIRAATIVCRYAKEADGIHLVDGNELEKSLVEQRVKALIDWLNSFGDELIPEPKGAYAWMTCARTYDNQASYKSWDIGYPNPGFIYQSPFHFTAWIEAFIAKLVRNEPLIDYSRAFERIEDLSEEELKKRVKELNSTIRHIEEPKFPKDVDHYVSLTRWAKEQAKFNDLDEYEDEKQEYEERLDEIKAPLLDSLHANNDDLEKNKGTKQEHEEWPDEIKAPLFDPQKNVLYIYQWGNIICKKEKHNLTDVSCSIPAIEEQVTVNAQYCRDCCKFVISSKTYEHFMETYKMLPIRFQFVNADGTFP